MEVRNCVKCKKVFQYLSGLVLCQDCKEQDEKDFQKVKEYLRKNHRATITEVSETLEVSIERISRYLKEGRLEMTTGSNVRGN